METDGFSRFCRMTRAARVDDRRVISGIVHVLKSGGRWVDAPDVYGPRKTLYNRFVRWAAKGVWVDIFHALAATDGASGAGADRQFRGQGAPLRRRGERGERAQAIGRSRGGRTTKIHALTDAACVPIAFLLTGGQIADRRLHGCRATPGENARSLDPAWRQRLRQQRRSPSGRRQGAMPNIPPKSNRRWKNCLSPFLYRNRNAIERMFCRLKDYRRIATRYDRLASNFLAATVSYWL